MYGIKNCDTVKKARTWLDGKGIVYRFHDFRVDGLDAPTLALWRDALGWEKLLNKSSTTFRGLPDDDRNGLDAEKAAALMLAYPTMIKRPVLDVDGRFMVGFKPALYEAFIQDVRA